MILHPKFYAPQKPDRRAELARLGLEPQLPTGLIMFGAEGSAKMVEIARRLNDSGLPIQLVFLSGRNHALAAQLRALSKKIPMAIEGFTKEVQFFMSLSDFFIGKAGPRVA
jgi:1,2-diacylglycerol 3-beta-galactosyltransferase